MGKKTLAGFLKLIILGAGICGLGIYFGVVPYFGQLMAKAAPEYGYCFWPWLIFLWLTGIPCYCVLFFGWKIASTIREDQEFSQINSRRFRWTARLAVGDAAFLVLGCILYWLMGMAHPSMVILGLGIGLLGAAAAVVFEALAQITAKAAALQEQSDFTI